MIQRVILILGTVVVVLGGGYYAFQQLLPPADQATGPVYATAPVVRGDISVGVDATGPLNPSRGGGIIVPGGRGPMPSGPTSFVVEAVLAEPGDAVGQGQVIVRLGTAELEAQIREKEKKLESDRRSLATMLGVPPENLDEVDQTRGMVLRAPIAGRVVGLSIKEGEELKQGQIIAKVVDDSRFRLVARLTTGEFQHVQPGQRVLLRFDQFAGFVEAQVTEINPDPILMKSSELIDSQPSFSEDQPSYRLVYWVTMEGDNPGLIGPDMPARVGLPSGDPADDDSGIEPLPMSRYQSKVEGYAEEKQILSGANAIATRVHVYNMQKVKTGDPLVSLIGEDARRMIAEQLDSIRLQESELQQLRMSLTQMEIRAPMDGVVANVEAQPGAGVSAGQWLGSIFNTSDMMMWVQVDDVDVLLVSQGAPVKVTVDALPGRTFEGEVENVATMGQDQSGITRFQVNIKVKGTPELRPGMQAHAYIDAGEAANVLLIPVEAIFEEDGQPRVELLTPDGAPRVVPIELGLMNDRIAEVKGGLEEGQVVITGSTADLLPSQRIQSDNLLPSTQGTDDGGNGTTDSDRDSGAQSGAGSR